MDYLKSKLDPKFNFQCSYDKTWQDRITIDDSGATIKLLEGDKPFKKGSDTKPRSEIRFNSLEEGEYNIATEFQIQKVDTSMQYSVFQIFASSPEIMVRKREGKWQVVAFSCKSKINVIPDLREDGSTNKIICHITPSDKKHQVARITINDAPTLVLECKFKQRDKMHCKLGPYAQQMDPIGETIIHYNYLEIDHLK